MQSIVRQQLALIAVLICAQAGCATSDGTPAASDGVIDRTISLAPPKDGYQLVTTPFVVPPTSEVEICSVVKIEPKAGEKFAWVGRFESLVSSGTHHMNVFMGNYSFLDGYLGDGAAENALGAKVGQYPCATLKTMESSFPVFPSQRENQQIVMPKGVGIPMPMPLLLVVSHHYLNTGERPIRINAMVNINTIPSEDVEHIAGLVFDSGEVDVPALSRKVSQRTCVFDRDVKVALVSTHNHQRTECATLNHFKPKAGGIAKKPFYVNLNWDQPPILHFKPGTFELKAGQGVHYACHYGNVTPKKLINDGTAVGEMCVFAAVVYPLKSSVAEVTEALGGTDIGKLLGFMGEAMGGCDSKVAAAWQPWPSAASPMDSSETTCKGLKQTTTNDPTW
jgi:hypothetical protein